MKNILRTILSTSEHKHEPLTGATPNLWTLFRAPMSSFPPLCFTMALDHPSGRVQRRKTDVSTLAHEYPLENILRITLIGQTPSQKEMVKYSSTDNYPLKDIEKVFIRGINAISNPCGEHSSLG